MNRLIFEAIKDRKITVLVAAIIMLFGIYSYYVIPKQENPDTTPPVALITTVYPGASSEYVEKLVTNKIENEVQAVNGVDYINSTSSESVSVIIVNLYFDADAENAWDTLRIKLNGISDELPQGCGSPVLKTDFLNSAGMIISLSGDGYTFDQLEAFAGDYIDILRKIDGISRFEINGKLDKQVVVKVDQSKLARYNLSLDDICSLLAAQNLEIPSGTIKTEKGEISVKTPGSFNNIDEIKNTVVLISYENAGMVRLKDIADVSMETEGGESRYYFEKEKAILLTGYFEQDKNIINIGKQVRKALDEINDKFPEDLNINEILFQPDDVNNSVNEFIISLLEGMLFVMLIVFLGMGIRNAVVVSAAVPLSIFTTLIIMKLFGLRLQQISIAALIISLGILVDNAIVISSSIQVKINEGEKQMKACFEGTKEASIPVLTSTLTTMAAFAPFLFLPGVAGEFVKSIPAVVITALACSYVIAILVTPSMGYFIFKPADKIKIKKDRLKNAFSFMLKGAINKKKITIIISILVFMVSILAVTLLDIQLFPYADKDMMYLDLRCEIKGELEKTEEFAGKVEDFLISQPEVTTYITGIGDALPKFYLTLPVYAASDDFAQIVFRYDLKKGGNRYKTAEEFSAYLQQELNRQISGGNIAVTMLQLTSPEPKINVKISGDNKEKLIEAAKEIRDELVETKGTIRVNDNIPVDIYQYSVNIDPDIAMGYGLTKYDIQSQINTALYGKTVSVYKKEGREYDIVVDSDITSKSCLEALNIKSAVTGLTAMLKQVADITLVKQSDSITHYNTNQCITVSSDVMPGYTPFNIQTYLETDIVPGLTNEDVDISFSGEKELIMDVFGDVGLLAVFALIIIYLILLWQFKRFRQPFIILATVPLSIIGSIFGLVIFNQPLSLTALLGIISLFGIVVNNAILLVEYINRAREEGHGIKEACMDAVKKRFTPVILTTATTIMGLVPLILTGSSFFTPMAVTLMSGLIVSSVLTIVIVPVIYSVFERNIKKA